jgi:hypothetical protein
MLQKERNPVMTKYNEAEAAIFSRNYKGHLDRACKASEKNPNHKSLFKSKRRWAFAKRCVDRFGSIPIYFAVNDGQSVVRYAAELCKIQLDPYKGSQTTQDFLSHGSEQIKKEELWDGKAKTLYLIRDCRKLSKTIAQNNFVKLFNGIPLSDKYQRGYAIVRRDDTAA